MLAFEKALLLKHPGRRHCAGLFCPFHQASLLEEKNPTFGGSSFPLEWAEARCPRVKEPHLQRNPRASALKWRPSRTEKAASSQEGDAAKGQVGGKRRLRVDQCCAALGDHLWETTDQCTDEPGTKKHCSVTGRSPSDTLGKPRPPVLKDHVHQQCLPSRRRPRCGSRHVYEWAVHGKKWPSSHYHCNVAWRGRRHQPSQQSQRDTAQSRLLPRPRHGRTRSLSAALSVPQLSRCDWPALKSPAALKTNSSNAKGHGEHSSTQPRGRAAVGGLTFLASSHQMPSSKAQEERETASAISHASTLARIALLSELIPEQNKASLHDAVAGGSAQW